MIENINNAFESDFVQTDDGSFSNQEDTRDDEGFVRAKTPSYSIERDDLNTKIEQQTLPELIEMTMSFDDELNLTIDHAA